MGEYDRVQIANWNDVLDHVRAFAPDDEVEERSDGVEVTVRDATLLVTKRGRIVADTALHHFEDGGVDVLYFDHDRDAVRVEGTSRSYEFRTPP